MSASSLFNSFMDKSGFTLIELLIVIMIIGILGSISYPLYNEHLTRTRRALAITTLMNLTGYMEEYYILNNSYDNAIIKSPKNLKDYYRLRLTTEHDTYILCADPLGKQAEADSKCGSLTIDQDGNKGITETCWY